MFRNAISLFARPAKKRAGERSKYKPHQSEREKLRRRVGGFHKLRRDLAAARQAGIRETLVV